MDQENNKDNLRAMVLAAGIGSRLAPLSDDLPKPLIRIAGKTIMDHILLHLKEHGITDVISNTHHLAQHIHDHFKDAKERLGVNIEFINEKELSGVAGGIRECQDFLKQGTACIIMGDALTDIDLTALYQEHKKAVKENNCLATMAMMQVEDTTQFGVIVTKQMLDAETQEAKSQVVRFQEKPPADEALSNWANTGVYFFEPGIYDFIPSKEEAPKYDVAKDLFPKLLEAGEFIQAIPVSAETYWADLGTPKQYLQSVADHMAGKIKLSSLEELNKGLKLGLNSKIEGACDIASDVEIGDNVVIKNSVLYPKVKIDSGSRIENSIIGSNSSIAQNSHLENTIEICTQVKS